MNGPKLSACALALALSVFSSGVAAAQSPWDTVLAKPPPAAHASDFRGKANAVFLDGEDWRGRPTRFFAWYALPDGASATNRCPGVVLVHGGEGTAFDWWVRLWNERGYAAKYALDGRPITKVGLAFSSKERNITEWKAK